MVVVKGSLAGVTERDTNCLQYTFTLGLILKQQSCSFHRGTRAEERKSVSKRWKTFIVGSLKQGTSHLSTQRSRILSSAEWKIWKLVEYKKFDSLYFAVMVEGRSQFCGGGLGTPSW